MEQENFKSLLDACFLAKRIVEKIPELPSNMKPRHIHVMDAVGQMSAKAGECRVSDVSACLGVSAPSITKLIQELESLGMVEKYGDSGDKRVSLVRLTKEGEACTRHYVTELHQEWMDQLHDVTDEEIKQTIRVIQRLWETLPKERN